MDGASARGGKELTHGLQGERDKGKRLEERLSCWVQTPVFADFWDDSFASVGGWRALLPVIGVATLGSRAHPSTGPISGAQPHGPG